MANFGSLPGFAAHMAGLAVAVEHARHEVLDEASKIVQTEAKRVIGTYDYDWPQLAEATQRQRVAEGFSANDPLLRTGALRDSIERTVGHDEAAIGSSSDVAVYQELGTKRIPPRPFLMGAAEHKIEEIQGLLGRKVRGVLVKG